MGIRDRLRRKKQLKASDFDSRNEFWNASFKAAAKEGIKARKKKLLEDREKEEMEREEWERTRLDPVGPPPREAFCSACGTKMVYEHVAGLRGLKFVCPQDFRHPAKFQSYKWSGRKTATWDEKKRQDDLRRGRHMDW